MNSCINCIHHKLCQKRGVPCDDFVNQLVVKGQMPITCLFNDGITCYDHSECAKCGWNPVVYKARKKQLRLQAACGLALHVQV